MRIIVLTVLLLLSSMAQAAEERTAVVRSSDNVVQGVYIIDPATTPPADGTYYAADPNGVASTGDTYDQGTQTFTQPALTPEQQAKVAARQAHVARQNSLKAEADVQAMVDKLTNATPAQIDAWIEANVTNLAQARNTLKAMLKVMAYSLRVEE